MAREKVFVNLSFTSEIIGKRLRKQVIAPGTEVRERAAGYKKEQDTKWAQKCAPRGGFSVGAV